MFKVLSGLEYMHERGVVHRDMNPTNVFIYHQGGESEENLEHCDPEIKILDFNVSKLVPLEHE